MRYSWSPSKEHAQTFLLTVYATCEYFCSLQEHSHGHAQLIYNANMAAGDYSVQTKTSMGILPSTFLFTCLLVLLKARVSSLNAPTINLYEA